MSGAHTVSVTVRLSPLASTNDTGIASSHAGSRWLVPQLASRTSTSTSPVFLTSTRSGRFPRMRSRGAIGCAACCAGRQKCGSGTRSCWPCTTTEMVTSGPPRAASISLRSSEPPGGSACCDERTSPEGDLMTPCWRTYSCSFSATLPARAVPASSASTAAAASTTMLCCRRSSSTNPGTVTSSSSSTGLWSEALMSMHAW
mmetsp:Transcript_14449/g.42103  ORF Transcript_14449/g.42103 Transcript_14449/m.42103 type:complete len:201 (-) Transcript_14449:4433-5035(-)